MCLCQSRLRLGDRGASWTPVRPCPAGPTRLFLLEGSRPQNPVSHRGPAPAQTDRLQAGAGWSASVILPPDVGWTPGVPSQGGLTRANWTPAPARSPRPFPPSRPINVHNGKSPGGPWKDGLPHTPRGL